MTPQADRAEAPAGDGMEPPRIAIVGAGVAGAACAAGLLRAGFDVTVFEKSGGVGGRMATRRMRWTDVDGTVGSVEFDHGCPHFTATRPRFRAVVRKAEALGCVTRWRQQVYATFPAPRARDVLVPTPGMPALARHLLSGVPLRLGHAVSGLQRSAGGWRLRLADGSADGPFEHVLLAIPAPQAAMLLGIHQTVWADALATVRMAPCWTLMAVTDDLDWPWDAAQIERGPLAWVARNDRAPGRCPPPGLVPWVAHASPAWSAAHLDDDPAQVEATLRAALGDLLAGARPARFHHTGVHRWRHAQLAQPASGGSDCWWSDSLGLGVCGDSFGDGSVEAAWCSGDELADAVAASFQAAPDACASPEAESTATAH